MCYAGDEPSIPGLTKFKFKPTAHVHETSQCFMYLCHQDQLTCWPIFLHDLHITMFNCEHSLSSTWMYTFSTSCCITTSQAVGGLRPTTITNPHLPQREPSFDWTSQTDRDSVPCPGKGHGQSDLQRLPESYNHTTCGYLASADNDQLKTPN